MAITLTRAGKWLGVTYAVCVLTFLLWNADAFAILLSFLILPWITGPAALAALATRSAAADKSAWAWAFFVLEVLVIASTLGVWIFLLVFSPDAQNGLAMLFFPILQYGAVGVLFGVAALTVVFSRKRALQSGP